MLTSNVQRRVLICLVLAVALTGTVVAQDYWMYPGRENSVSLQVFKPAIKKEHSYEYQEYDFFTNTCVFSAKIRTSNETAVLISVPMSNVVFRDVWDWEDEHYVSPTMKTTLIGNPYLGVELGRRKGDQTARPVGRIGFRPAVASDQKGIGTYVGGLTLFNSFEGFAPDLWALQFGMGTELESKSGVGGSVNIDAAVMIPTADGADTEVFGNYNLTLAYSRDAFTGGIGFAGRIWVTEGDMDFGERTAHQLGFTAGYQVGSFKPGMHFRLPLDEDLRDYVDFIYGISLTFDLQ